MGILIKGSCLKGMARKFAVRHFANEKERFEKFFQKFNEITKYFFQVLETLDLGADVKKDRLREVPPYTGFGSEEDSLTSCQVKDGNKLERLCKAFT